MDSVFCCRRLQLQPFLSVPLGLFSASSGSSSSEIRRSSSTVEHLEKADFSVLSLNVKSSRYTKGHLGSAEPHQLEQTSSFRFDFTPTKILYYPTCARESPPRLSPVSSTGLLSHPLCLIFSRFTGRQNSIVSSTVPASNEIFFPPL